MDPNEKQKLQNSIDEKDSVIGKLKEENEEAARNLESARSVQDELLEKEQRSAQVIASLQEKLLQKEQSEARLLERLSTLEQNSLERIKDLENQQSSGDQELQSLEKTINVRKIYIE